MGFCKSFVAALVLVSLLAALTEAKKFVYFQRACFPPAEGLWRIENRFPEEIGSDKLALDAVSEVTITKAFDSVYTGTGLSDRFIPTLAEDLPVKLVATFDAETCVLSGTAFGPNGTSTSFAWKSRGTKMKGGYILTVNGVVALLDVGTNVATWVE